VFPRRVGECVVVSDVTEEEIAYGVGIVVESSSRRVAENHSPAT
jgi:hypothetical protein